MGMDDTVQAHLRAREIPFEQFSHGPLRGTSEAAKALGFVPEQLARAALLQDGLGLLLAVIPSNHRIGLTHLRHHLARPELVPSPPTAIRLHLGGCDPGALPPFGGLYGIETVVDWELLARDGVYFTPGNRHTLIRLQSDLFERLHAGSQWAYISRPAKPRVAAVRCLPFSLATRALRPVARIPRRFGQRSAPTC